MSTRPMYNRRAIRPDGKFHRGRRRNGVNMLAMLEGKTQDRPGLVARIESFLKKLLRIR